MNLSDFESGVRLGPSHDRTQAEFAESCLITALPTSNPTDW